MEENQYTNPGAEDNSNLYSDARYTPSDSGTNVNRYYTPPMPPQPKEKKEKKKTGFWKTLFICLLCVALAVGGTAYYMTGEMNKKVAELRGEIEAKSSEIDLIQDEIKKEATVRTVEEVTDSDRLAPSVIFENACEQVVGITTEVTYTNFFGQTSSSPVTGSGFLISSDGYILTNYHVIEYAYEYDYEISVMLHDKSTYVATIIGTERDNDIAVLKIDVTDMTPAVFGKSSDILVGDTIYAVGNPLGELEFTMTTGTVTALDREIITDNTASPISMFQIDAAVNSGNSGGPVYNTRGEVVGIVTAKSSGTGIEGIGFAIPADDAASIAADLMEKGYVSGKARLGIQMDVRYNASYANYYNLPVGAYVYFVEPGSCAETAGIRSGDIITKLNDLDIENHEELSNAIKKSKAGDEAKITLYRSGEYIEVELIFDESKPTAPTATPAPVEEDEDLLTDETKPSPTPGVSELPAPPADQDELGQLFEEYGLGDLFQQFSSGDLSALEDLFGLFSGR